MTKFTYKITLPETSFDATCVRGDGFEYAMEEFIAERDARKSETLELHYHQVMTRKVFDGWNHVLEHTVEAVESVKVEIEYDYDPDHSYGDGHHYSFKILGELSEEELSEANLEVTKMLSRLRMMVETGKVEVPTVELEMLMKSRAWN